MVRVQ